jgi:hypothetical protein
MKPPWWNLVDTRDLKSLDFGRPGSSPGGGTTIDILVKLCYNIHHEYF